MKRPAALLICISMCLVLFGCRGRTLRPVPPALPDSFSCAVHITADDLAIDAAWLVSHGESTFTVRAPEELCGVTVRCTADGSKMALDGTETALPDTSPFVRIADAYRSFVLASPEGELTAQGWLYDLSEKGFTVLQDADNGLPLRLSMPEQGITVTFPEDIVTQRREAPEQSAQAPVSAY